MKRLLLLMSLALASVISSQGQQIQQRASSDSNSSARQQQDLVQVIKQCVDSVVLIEVRDTSDKVMRTGSGFVASPDGRIVTNYHVIKDAPSAYIKLNNGAFFKVDGLVASDADADVAIIKVAGNNLPVLVFGDSDKASVGETVIAIGSPLGLANSVSTGIISGLRDDSGRKWIQTTAAVSPRKQRWSLDQLRRTSPRYGHDEGCWRREFEFCYSSEYGQEPARIRWIRGQTTRRHLP